VDERNTSTASTRSERSERSDAANESNVPHAANDSNDLGCYAQSVLRLYSGALILVFAVSLAGCRQADGPMPEATESVANELGDITRDLQSAAYRNPSGVQDLSDDIGHYAQGTDGGEAAAQELARRLGEALAGKMFKVAQAMPVAHSAWVAVAARQLSAQQIEGLKNEMKSELMALGVDERQAESVADQVGVVQQAVTARHRRWYERL